jgi:hypothetical protein
MPNTRSRYFLDIEPELRNRLKAQAALQGKTMKGWLTEAIIAKLEDEIDINEGLASLADTTRTSKFDGLVKEARKRATKTGLKRADINNAITKPRIQK